MFGAKIWSLRMALMAEERRRKKQNSNERGERRERISGVAAGEGERGGSRAMTKMPPILFRLFLVQVESFLLPLI